MTEAIINFFRDLLGNDYLTTFIIAIIPIVELRGAIPVAIEMGLSWWQAFGLAYLGSCIVVPILLLLLRPILNLMKKVKIFARLANAVEDMFKEKAAKIAKKVGGGEGDTTKKEDWIKFIGVFTFVALPIPLTGVWTGTAVAVFLGMPFRKSLSAVVLGNLTAGAIVTLLSVFFKSYLDYILTGFFILVLIIIVFYIIMLTIRMIKSKKKDNLNKKNNTSVRDLDTSSIENATDAESSSAVDEDMVCKAKEADEDETNDEKADKVSNK